MMETIYTNFPIIMGMTAAIVHVLTGPDHLAAVAPLVLDTKKGHWRIGFLWGIGHIGGMLLIGILYYFFKDYIPVDIISTYSEQLVGIILIGLGLWAFYRIKHEKSGHKHPHIHLEDKETFIHIHGHKHKQKKHDHNDNHTEKTEKHHHTNPIKSHIHSHEKTIKQNNLTATIVGIIHGFAGVSHFILMLPVLGYKSKIHSIQYITGFGFGIIFAMVFFAVIIGKLHKTRSGKHDKHVLANFRFWGGLAAILVGVFWLFSNG